MSCNNLTCPFRIEVSVGDTCAAEDAGARCIISESGQAMKFRKHQILFRQGQTSSSVYSLSSGLVKIGCSTPDGREQIIGLAHPGNLLVGLQSICDENYAYSAVAATSVSACKINHTALLAKAKEDGDVAMIVIRFLTAQLAHSRALMEVMGHKSAAAKIASLILLMVPKERHGDTQFNLAFSRREIASLLNLSEETVCRIMAELKRSGVIEAPRRFVAIVDWDQLRTIANGAVS